MFSYEYCEIFKKTYFEEHVRIAASVDFLPPPLMILFFLLNPINEIEVRHIIMFLSPIKAIAVNSALAKNIKLFISVVSSHLS